MIEPASSTFFLGEFSHGSKDPTESDLKPLVEHIIAVASSVIDRKYSIQYKLDEEDKLMGEINWPATSGENWLAIFVYTDGSLIISPTSEIWCPQNDSQYVTRITLALKQYLAQ